MNQQEDPKQEGVKWCIEKLRELQSRFWHTRVWNHSGETKFAPVELSDFLLLEYEKMLEEKKLNK